MKFNDAFWRWFDGSFVVDAEGDPLTVYHGVYHTKFTTFRTPAYFAENPDYAELFMLEQGHVLPCYLSIKNPLDLTQFGLDRIEYETLIALFMDFGMDVSKKFSMLSRSGYRAPVWNFVRDLVQDGSMVFKDAIKKSDIDGLYQIESGFGLKAKVWVPFHPSQIKSAIGNDGSWDGDDDDIRSNPKRRRR